MAGDNKVIVGTGGVVTFPENSLGKAFGFNVQFWALNVELDMAEITQPGEFWRSYDIRSAGGTATVSGQLEKNATATDEHDPMPPALFAENPDHANLFGTYVLQALSGHTFTFSGWAVKGTMARSGLEGQMTLTVLVDGPITESWKSW